MPINPQSQVHPDAHLGEGVSVGPFTTIAQGVTIGAGTEIGSNVVIERNCVIGERCRIFHGASLGGEPQVSGFDDVPSSIEIGDDTIIREYVTVHRSMKENGVTRIGSHTFLMAYAHVAHDCKVGNKVVIVNQTNLAGHVEVEDHAFISGMVAVHQFVRIGAHSMVGGHTAIRQDVLPFSLVEGKRLVSINSVGLRRRNFAPKTRKDLKEAMRILKDPELNARQSVERILAEIENTEEIRYLTDFMQNTSRGFVI